MSGIIKRQGRITPHPSGAGTNLGATGVNRGRRPSRTSMLLPQISTTDSAGAHTRRRTWSLVRGAEEISAQPGAKRHKAEFEPGYCPVDDAIDPVSGSRERVEPSTNVDLVPRPLSFRARLVEIRRRQSVLVDRQVEKLDDDLGVAVGDNSHGPSLRHPTPTVRE